MDGLKTDMLSISRSSGCPLRYSVKTFRGFATFLVILLMKYFLYHKKIWNIFLLSSEQKYKRMGEGENSGLLDTNFNLTSHLPISVNTFLVEQWVFIINTFKRV